MKKVLFSIFFLLILSQFSFVVSAEPKKMSDGNIFDGEYYAKTNPDIVSVLGTDETTLFELW